MHSVQFNALLGCNFENYRMISVRFQDKTFNIAVMQSKPKKMMLRKCCTQYVKIWKTQQWPQDWKRSVFIPIPKKGNPKECSNYCTIAFTSPASKVMFKILQARLLQYTNHELPDVQAAFRKCRGTEIKMPTATGYRKIKRVPEKHQFLIY